MSKFKVDVKLGNGHAEQAFGPGHAKQASGPEIEETDQTSTNLAGRVAVIGAVGVGVALISAELLPGVVIGVAAAMAPKYIPTLGRRIKPLFKSTVRGAYKLGRQAQKRVNDIKAEVATASNAADRQLAALGRSGNRPAA